MLRPTVVATVALAAALVAAAPASGVIDPERNATTPTGWHWWTGQMPAQLEQRAAANGERVISINADNPYGTRFTAALVRNTGVYARDGDFFVNKTASQVKGLLAGRRLIDLEPYVLFGVLRFAGVTVPNSGTSRKWWWWNYDLTAAQVTADINKHDIRLIDLSTYVRGGKRRYAYVGIRNAGRDATAWWWYHDVSPAYVQAKADQHGARLIDIERPSPGRLTVVMVKSQGEYTRHAWGKSATELLQYAQSHGVRITDIERYGNRLAAVMLDNATAETGRVRSRILRSPYRDSFFGAFSKQVAGPTYVGLAHHARYQPMSVMKLVPHLYVMDLLDRGTVNLDAPNGISWTAPKSKPDAVWCPSHGGPTESFSESLRTTLTRALGESLNRAHEALLVKYTPEAITDRVQAMGLEQTDMYYGCKYPGKPDWTSSRTTLSDMGELFEGVDTKRWFPNQWQAVRDEFYGLMATWPAMWLQPVVQSEAAKQGKSGAVGAFMSEVVLKGKGGGADWPLGVGTWRSGRAFSFHVELPIKTRRIPLRHTDPDRAEPGRDRDLERERRGPAGPTARAAATTVPRAYVGGFFANGIPALCREADVTEKPNQVSDACKAWATKMGDTFRDLTAETLRVPIRQALKTW